MRCTARLFIAVCVAIPAGIDAQQVRTLPAPDAVFNDPFSDLSSVRELSGGRVLVTDRREKLLGLIDFRTQSLTKIGREGSGPGEFGFPSRVFGVRGDTTFLYDPANTRLLVLGPNGQPVSSFRPEPGGSPQTPGQTSPFTSEPVACDSMGRLYFVSRPTRFSKPGDAPAPDTTWVLRYDRASFRMDTIAALRVPMLIRMEVPNGTRTIPPHPLLPRDAFDVYPDGRVAIVRAPEYRVDWTTPDRRTREGTANPFTSIRITDAERSAFTAQLQRVIENSYGTRRTGDGVTTIVPAPRGGPPMQFDNWPSVLSPVSTLPLTPGALIGGLSGAGIVSALPNGQLWVRRTEAGAAAGILVDVINAQGAVAHQLRLPEGVTVVGFGDRSVYTTLADTDGLLTLRRHRLP